MPRNLVLCCDGTSNQFSKARTSVIKLFHALDKDPARQAVYYHPGIGTRAPTGVGPGPGTWVTKPAGLAFGYGLQDDIVDAYRFLMNTYQPGDQLFIFGFSRGAYTARVIAAMVHMYGLAAAGNDALVPFAVRMMWAISKLTDEKARDDYFRLAEDFKATISSRDCPTRFLGVWDTVNSVGWIGSPLTLPFTRDNPDIATIRHAKAIDERRGFFRVNWFTDHPDLKEVWFPGTHCDVGGGFPEADSGISKYPLEWMAMEAKAAGLLLDPKRLSDVLGDTDPRYAKASPTATLHLSMGLLWGLTEVVPRKHWNWKTAKWEWRANLFRRRTLPDAPAVHRVAWDIPGYTVPAGAIQV
jgi:uncharacterized protein (DUF2235 family)